MTSKGEKVEIYTDYLLSQFGAATATGLSEMLGGEISHDQITRLLSGEEYDSKALWGLVKKVVREIESEEGVLIFDDTIQEKAYTEESDLNCWHYDHSQGRSVKGMNLLNALYHSSGTSIPVAFELVKKPLVETESTDSEDMEQPIKKERKSQISTNERLRNMLAVCVKKT